MFGGDDDAVVRREAERLAALRRYDVLDTPDEAAFDRIARLAAEIVGTPMALVSLIDEHRQWFKAKVGIERSETPRDVAFCAHAILSDELMMVPDAAKSPRFANHPSVVGVDGILAITDPLQATAPRVSASARRNAADSPKSARVNTSARRAGHRTPRWRASSAWAVKA